jgi:hypothetical protein
MKWKISKCIDKYMIDVYCDELFGYIIMLMFDDEGRYPLIFDTEEEVDEYMKNKTYEDLIHI